MFTEIAKVRQFFAFCSVLFIYELKCVIVFIQTSFKCISIGGLTKVRNKIQVKC